MHCHVTLSFFIISTGSIYKYSLLHKRHTLYSHAEGNDSLCLIKDKTVMIIAHRMRTVANADKIVVLKDGVVAESGTPSELDEKDGIYANMVKTQNLAADWAL